VAEEDWEEWDVCVSLFDNKRSASMEVSSWHARSF
jgi:hypothetical protein